MTSTEGEEWDDGQRYQKAARRSSERRVESLKAQCQMYERFRKYDACVVRDMMTAGIEIR